MRNTEVNKITILRHKTKYLITCWQIPRKDVCVYMINFVIHVRKHCNRVKHILIVTIATTDFSILCNWIYTYPAS